MTANLLSLTSSWPAERHLAGMCTGAAAWTIAQRVDGPTLVVAPSTAVATQLVEDIGFHLGTGHLVHRLPGDDVRPYEGLSPHPSVIRARIDATARLHRDEPCVVVTDPAGLSLRLLSKDALADLTAHLALPPVAEVSLDFGAHLASPCTGCHGPALSGGPIPGGDPSWVPARNLTPSDDGMAGWSFADFEGAMRDGMRPDGTPLQMPMTLVLPYTTNLTGVEMEALWMYLSSLDPLPTGAM